MSRYNGISMGDKIFLLWVLSLPFYRYSLIGTLSVDNLLVPVLLTILLFRLIAGRIRLSKSQYLALVWSVVLAIAYLLSHTANLLTTQRVVWAMAYTAATDMVYYLLPVFFLTHRALCEKQDKVIVTIAIIGALTAFMAATGLVHFEYERQAPSRLGLEFLPKSVGLFTAYGDMAALLSFAVIYALHKKEEGIWLPHHKGIQWKIVLLAVFLGIISMQSRNVLMTVIVSYLAYKVLVKWIRLPVLFAGRVYMTILVGIILSAISIALFSGPLIEFVSGLGGTKEAAATVRARLGQYAFGWSLIKDNPLFGADPDIQEKITQGIGFIHNMWLKEMVLGGVPALLAILIIYFRAIAIQIRMAREGAIREGRAGSSLAYLSMLIGGLVGTQFYPSGTPTFWVLVGTASSLPLVLSKKIYKEKGQDGMNKITVDIRHNA